MTLPGATNKGINAVIGESLVATQLPEMQAILYLAYNAVIEVHKPENIYFVFGAESSECFPR
jgi:hypothetical protein